MDDYKNLISNPDEAFKDIDIDVLSALWYWQKNDGNSKADELNVDCSDSEYLTITKVINVGGIDNSERKNIFKSAFNKLP